VRFFSARHDAFRQRLRELQFTGFDIEKVRTLFTELEFTNLTKLIENGG